ncbi:3-hydroxyisobutyryl-CoA hydrolase, mitochondrial isoform X2 [Plodia interpunctella]|nr:3-hydroxyisobutyryl-CoA hydrolase, mitochondrial isoform X2 [Plodia interpunctella]XP_053603460.1 3-hydroxyisobutyryl-CoA hydrolase, mitochondrial isoform X2 [Plodia interpunctella]XP_053603461.1 3-hydroxyisobutyryl-CoA hydrolase, mitochondrial isoform X2 [Plodia interpunctella]XP_053603462.1 3-hydroxyisobutyryl-CoA hydrolase, mitochondrial isoform X2 [Plodia interpunctella]XP_053603463.1 3-hydroxyisobutyryl-CoA hydrolase, mitochondrial isoform X2 [Plodia interpunctella]
MFKLGINTSRNISIVFKRTMSSQEPDILTETLNNAGVLTLNRPKALNSLNESMVTKILAQLREWEKSKTMVIVKGAGDRAFCAGGDVKVAIDKVKGPQFFYPEYNCNYLIGKYKIPYIALIDGITMGGGMGVSVHGRYRVATERTVIAMPETRIGLFPDVGGSYFLPRLQVNLGLYLGLTGDRLKGKDVVKSGIATHFVSSSRLYELETLLSRCTNDVEISALLNKFNEPPEEFTLAPNIKHINYCFAASTVEEIIERLEKVNNDWSQKTIQTLHEMCPGSLKITLRALQRGAQLSLAHCLRMEYRVACWSTRHHDFPEGVRALLIDKDNNPRWTHKSVREVDDDYVEQFFKKLPQDQELKFFDEDSKL